jgi:hypothetical protein
VSEKLIVYEKRSEEKRNTSRTWPSAFSPTNFGRKQWGTRPPEFWVGGTPICDVPPRIWLKIDRNVKYFLRISGDFVTNLMHINSSLQTKNVLNSVTVSHNHRERFDTLGITSLLRDFAPRSELRRRIFGKFG